jgi:hypothetical protein
MATNRTRRSRNRRDNIVALTGPQRDDLLHGHDFFKGAWQGPDDRRKAWELHRDDLVQFWTQDPDAWLAAGNQRDFGNPEPDGPGTRPRAFWDFDAVEDMVTISPAEQIEMEILKRGEADYTGNADIPQSYFYQDQGETEVAYLHRLELLSKGELAYLQKLSPDPTDWDFLQRNGWLTAGGRRWWFLSFCRNLTPKGIASARLDLLYLQRLGLSPVVPRDVMEQESEHSAFRQLADLVIIEE